MDKIKLTREQAEAIESLDSEKWEIVQTHIDECWTHPKYKCLNLLGNDEFIKALYIGYEIKREFVVGDWVVYFNGEPHGNKTNKIELIEDGRGYFDEYRRRSMLLDSLRHATPEEIAGEKERRWWAKYNRKVWEIQEGDCLISKHDKSSCQVKFVEASDEVSVLLVDGIQDEFYEGEHDLKIMRDRYDVFCFAEDRKDE